MKSFIERNPIYFMRNIMKILIKLIYDMIRNEGFLTNYCTVGSLRETLVKPIVFRFHWRTCRQ